MFFDIMAISRDTILENKILTTYSFIHLNRSEFVPTLTELNAIAPAANIGSNIPIAASGMPILHYRSGRPPNKMASKQVRVAREKMLFDRAHGVCGKDEWTVH